MFTFDLFATEVGHTTFALMNSLTESIIMRIPLCLTFSYLFGLGFEEIYFGEAFSPLVSAIIGILYFRREKWKNVKLMETK